MTSNESKDQLPGSKQVSRAFRAANFDEVPPAAIDRAILIAARRESRRPLPAYLPPFALAATIVLSVSLVFRFGVLNENTEIFSEPARAPATSIGLDGNPPQEEAAAPEDSATLPDDDVTTGELQLFMVPQDETAGADNAFEVAPPVPRPDIELRARQAQPEIVEELLQNQQAAEPAVLQSVTASARTVTFAKIDCTATDREEAASWLECITTILTSGSEDAAREELSAFVEIHPGYALPADLEAALGL